MYKEGISMLSVVIPAYNEEAIIKKTASVIADILKKAKIEYELIFVNDGSKDNTWNNIVAANSLDSNVRGLCFSRNFGKESAMLAGLTHATGDCVAVIDCDLQHPPEKLVEMYRLWEEGYEVVEGVKASRGEESAIKGFAAKTFYKIISKAVGIDMSRASDFKLLDRKAIDVIISMPERNAFFRALSSWVGFKSTQVEYDVREREEGTSKWSTKSLISYAISNITAFTTLPMKMIIYLGVIMLFLSCVFGIVSIVQKLAGVALDGFTTVILLICFSSSVIVISLGIIGYYISRIYDEIKGRPRFIIAKEVGKRE